ncbi:MAG: hypothetical protein VB144_11775 [Clostridia bacterium]|nr:hypothetical protein [Clostridia bacterium]
MKTTFYVSSDAKLARATVIMPIPDYPGMAPFISLDIDGASLYLSAAQAWQIADQLRFAAADLEQRMEKPPTDAPVAAVA